MEEALRQEGRFSEQLEQDVSGLQQALGLGTKEALSLRNEISSKIYRSDHLTAPDCPSVQCDNL